jgi:hypothetical protein
VRLFAASILWCTFAFAQAPDDKCSVEGTVINSATGEPVKKARVVLAPIARDQDAFATTADAAGHFLIDDVDAGQYSLTATRSGYIQPRSLHGSANHAFFTLDKGQKMKEVVVKLAPEGLIAGRVLDEDGDPMAYVAIECMSVGYEHGKHKLIGHAETNTNDLGEFRLPGLTAGRYIVGAVFQAQNMYWGIDVQQRPVRTPGQAAEEAYVTTYYPRTMNLNSASTIEVSPGAQISGIILAPMRSRTVHIKGRVGATQVHAAQIFLRLDRREEMGSGAPFGSPVAPQGDFQLQGVVPGSYVLHASCITRDRKVYSARMPLEVRDSSIEGIELELRPATEVPGRVIIEDKGDLHGATLYAEIQGKDGEFVMGGMAAEVKEDLTFKIPNVGMQPYDFILHGYPESFYLKSVRMGDQDVTETGIDLAQQAAAGELIVVLSPNAGAVEGSVQNSKEEPAIGAKVTLIPDAKHRASTSLYKTADTDQNGHFIMKGVTPGEYKIFAWEDIEEGAYEDPDFMKPHESDGQTVSIKERGHETVELKAIPTERTAKEKPER